jgi:hypothetical protein
MFVLLAVFWLTITHLQSRFFILALPIAAFPIGQLPTRRIAAAVVALMLIFSTASIASKFTRQSCPSVMLRLSGWKISGSSYPKIL